MTNKFGIPVNGGQQGIVPGTGAFDLGWPASGAIPASYSAGGWTDGNEGFVQQTFLGASIRSFNVNGGFGHSSSTCSVQLVNDEYNKSDGTGQGAGDDVYHNGAHDLFVPPPVGSPVFFKFGKNHATIEQSWRLTLDQTYGYSTMPNIEEGEIIAVSGSVDASGNVIAIPDTGVYHSGVQDTGKDWIDKKAMFDPSYAGRGRNHFAFGGILQSYTQNRGNGGNPLYSVNVTDPREILSNVSLILNNYGGTTFDNKNLYNVFGFLEFDPTDSLKSVFESHYSYKNLLGKAVNPSTGAVLYSGDDMYTKSPLINPVGTTISSDGIIDFGVLSALPPSFPVTGKGMSRRSDKGIPLYRVLQAVSVLCEFQGRMPYEYREAAFGGFVDFRGFNYVVDFGGIPIEKIPSYYFMDFDQINLLEFAQELCDILSHDMFVSLLPVLDHPASEFLWDWNNWAAVNDPKNVVAGIIRVDAIDRSSQPSYGAIKTYIDTLATRGIEVENQDVGFELSNVTTDKFIVGANEVEMHYFSGNTDRGNVEVRKHKAGLPNKCNFLLGDQWYLHNALKQQIVPFYGFLGKDAVTIPRGWGSYSQILLDTTDLNAYGVGNYYVATELELRCAALSYKDWKAFLLQYNDTYMESMRAADVIGAAVLKQVSEEQLGSINPEAGPLYGVSVPRCVWRSDRNYLGDNGLPASPCSPPFGYPLYYKRAEQIGIPEAGVVKIAAAKTQIMTNLANLTSKGGEKKYKQWVVSNLQEMLFGEIPRGDVEVAEDVEVNVIEVVEHVIQVLLGNRDWNDFDIDKSGLSQQRKAFLKSMIHNTADKGYAATVANLQVVLSNNCAALKNIQRLGEKSIENSMKVYNFLKSVADKHLGKTFLVKLPKETSLSYSNHITIVNGNPLVCEIATGPFGFKPRPINSEPGYYYTQAFQEHLQSLMVVPDGSYTNGALKNNYNPMSDQWEYNYMPDPQGGFFEFGLFGNAMRPQDLADLPPDRLPLGTLHQLCPKDLTNFVKEDGRISCYVRFDHSQFLNFSSVGADSIEQEVITSKGFIPDIAMELENTHQDKFQSLDVSAKLRSLAPTTAFVKCEVDEQLYMPPTSISFRDKVFGSNVIDIGGQTAPRPIYDKEECKFIDSLTYYDAVWVPDPTDQGEGSVVQEDFVRNYSSMLGGDIIQTNIESLDSSSVYAMITLPGKVIPTIDSRMKDGPYQMGQPVLFKHLLAMDTVKGVKGFEKPSARGYGRNLLDAVCSAAPSDAIANSFAAYGEAMSKVTIAGAAARLHFAAPSPIYPDMVALPLLSKDRCYGPWISSQVNLDAARLATMDLGGKVEFIKEENLAPWNYDGYQLMNDAGSLQAQFSNGLLLFSERGGFVFPGAPEGNTLCQPLSAGGPLVTNITVDVGPGGVKTTYKMDLYTPRFGKLHVQKEKAIAQITRERQKLKDQRNTMIRRGIGKSATSNNYSQILGQYDNFMKSANYWQTFVGNIER